MAPDPTKPYGLHGRLFRRQRLGLISRRFLNVFIQLVGLVIDALAVDIARVGESVVYVFKYIPNFAQLGMFNHKVGAGVGTGAPESAPESVPESAPKSVPDSKDIMASTGGFSGCSDGCSVGSAGRTSEVRLCPASRWCSPWGSRP